MWGLGRLPASGTNTGLRCWERDANDTATRTATPITFPPAVNKLYHYRIILSFPPPLLRIRIGEGLIAKSPLQLMTLSGITCMTCIVACTSKKKQKKTQVEPHLHQGCACREKRCYCQWVKRGVEESSPRSQN